jgi:hypothetical protein
MLSDTGELNRLLSSVSPEHAATGARYIPLFLEKTATSSTILFSAEANWTTRIDRTRSKNTGPRHLTLRRRGRAMPYPRIAELNRGTEGSLVVLRGGLSLEPADARKPCLHIPAESIQQTSFYADCIDVMQTSGNRILIRCEGADALSVTFEAYFNRS